MVRSFRLLAVAAIFLVASVAAGGSLPKAVEDHLDDFVAGRMEAWDTPGLSLVVVREGEVALARGYGFADREAGLAMTEETLVMLGSTTKAMTALAVMQLVEVGPIELGAPVTRYLPWFVTPEGHEHDITVRQLLSHTSGYPWGLLFSGHDYPRELEDYVRWLGRVRLATEPGARFGYSNDTFVVLGLIVERVSEMSYQDYMHQNLFEPLAMTRTTFELEVAEQRGLARGYRNDSGVAVPFDIGFAPSERPAGKLMTSALELGNYFTMLLAGGRFQGGEVISEGALKQMWTPVVSVDEEVSYGLAWYLSDAGGLKLVSHPGSVRNSGSRFVLVPEASLAVGVMSNISRPLDPRNEVAESITVATLLFGDYPLDAPGPPSFAMYSGDGEVWSDVVGEYSSAAGPVTIFAEEGRLVGTVYGHRFGLDPTGEATFKVRSEFAPLDGLELEFQPADPGEASWRAGSDRLALLGQWFAFKVD